MPTIVFLLHTILSHYIIPIIQLGSTLFNIVTLVYNLSNITYAE